MKAALMLGIPAAGGAQGAGGGEGLQGKGFVRGPAGSVRGPPGSSVSPPFRSRCAREPGQGGARRGGAGPRGRQGTAARSALKLPGKAALPSHLPPGLFSHPGRGRFPGCSPRTPPPLPSASDPLLGPLALARIWKRSGRISKASRRSSPSWRARAGERRLKALI